MTDDDDRYAHKPEEFLTFFVMLSGNSNGSSCEFVYLFSGTCFLGLFALRFCFLSPFKTFRELHVRARQ
jgi:hypothetical protein